MAAAPTHYTCRIPDPPNCGQFGRLGAGAYRQLQVYGWLLFHASKFCDREVEKLQNASPQQLLPTADTLQWLQWATFLALVGIGSMAMMSGRACGGRAAKKMRVGSPILNEPEKDSQSHAKNLLQVPFYDASVAPTGAGGAIRAGAPVIVG